MAHFTLSINAPTLSAYDPDNPTQATEELNLQLHNVLQDMEDSGWKLDDDKLVGGAWTTIESNIFTALKVVHDYAALAITNYRDHGTPDIAVPTTASLSALNYNGDYAFVAKFQLTLWKQCYSMLLAIYYLWQTEEDPLRIKDYIRDMLMAWPLQDIAIDLNDETGTSLKIYPQWKNLET